MVNRTLNPKRGKFFGVKSNCETTAMRRQKLVGIINMNVLPDYQRKGIGSKLLRRAYELAKVLKLP